MRRRLALPLLVGLLAAVWAGPAAAASIAWPSR